MRVGEFWDSKAVCVNKVDEECIIHEINKNKDNTITVEVRINAYNIDKESDCYTGVVRLRLKKDKEEIIKEQAKIQAGDGK